MITLVEINTKTPQAKQFVKFTRTLPFVTVFETKKKCFSAEVAKCDGRPASEFFCELRRQVKENFSNA
ncbi:MAG: hypothetical protein LBC84_06610 [Prevotellaceae bacterium]|jgi:hypothetical protein|nr:hypothetical protein [Prevotellaceae bacterium]